MFMLFVSKSFCYVFLCVLAGAFSLSERQCNFTRPSAPALQDCFRNQPGTRIGVCKWLCLVDGWELWFITC